MAHIPTTSLTLLRDLSSGSENPRWNEFVCRYRPMMEGFLRSRFPFLEPDDIIQETLIAFAAALPRYRYLPEEKGYFHNYLTGILRHKAVNILRARKRLGEVRCEYAEELTPAPVEEETPRDEDSWIKATYEIALQQLMADPKVLDRSKEIFNRTAIKGEAPDVVAISMGMTRNAVDQVKWRMTRKLKRLVEDLQRVDAP